MNVARRCANRGAESLRCRRWRRTAAILFATSASAGLAGAGASTSTALMTVTPDPPVCPKHAPSRIPAANWSAARKQLAPRGATELRLCRYSGLNAHPRLRLRSSRLVESQREVNRLVAEFDRLPALTGEVSCPMDDGSQIVAVLAYPSGKLVRVSLGLTGCQLVTNGSVHRTAAAFGRPPHAGPPLVEQLEQLVR